MATRCAGCAICRRLRVGVWLHAALSAGAGVVAASALLGPSSLRLIGKWRTQVKDVMLGYKDKEKSAE